MIAVANLGNSGIHQPPPTPITHTYTLPMSPPLPVPKRKVQVIMMRNEAGYRRLKSIYIEYKEQKINTWNKNKHK